MLLEICEKKLICLLPFLFLFSFTKVQAQEPDYILLARLIFSEAAKESTMGKIAVAWVVRNRVTSKKFPNTYRKVILQRWQFTGVNSPLWRKTYYPERMTIQEKKVFEECIDIAKKVIQGIISDPAFGSDHYYNPRLVSPFWAKKMKQIVTIGNHLFLKS